jgi:hypothetical protein
VLADGEDILVDGGGSDVMQDIEHKVEGSR